MYLAAFFTSYKVIWHTIQRDKISATKEQLDSLTSWIIAGLLIGGRIGYVLFYNLPYYLNHPSEAILPFSFVDGFHFTGISGMSYHGGLIGAFLAASYVLRKNRWNYGQWVNLIMSAIPLGYAWGRLGNFINGELYGRETTASIGMLFPLDHLQVLRHPSQLYELFFEGLVLFAILQWTYRKPSLKSYMLSFYLIGYGLFRFMIEFFREPDVQIGLNAFGLSRGQLLCIAMVAVGVGIALVQKHLLKFSIL